MTLAPDQLPDDVAALQAIIAKQAAELAEQTAALEDAKNQLKARDVVIEQLQLNLDKLIGEATTSDRSAGIGARRSSDRSRRREGRSEQRR